jgi:hypothetical protein
MSSLSAIDLDVVEVVKYGQEGRGVDILGERIEGVSTRDAIIVKYRLLN